MTEKTGNVNAYLNARMNQMTNLKSSGTHVLQKDESLWSIASKELGKGAKNSEINEYMLQIAKLNGFDTVEKMNSIKINTVLNMPVKDTQASNKGKQAQKTQTAQTNHKTVTKPQTTTTPARAQKANAAAPAQKTKTNQAQSTQVAAKSDAEKIFERCCNDIIGNNPIYVQKGWGLDMYHVYKETKQEDKSPANYNHTYERTVPSLVMSFEIKNGKIISHSFYNHSEKGIDNYIIKGNKILKYNNLLPDDKYPNVGNVESAKIQQVDKKLLALAEQYQQKQNNRLFFK